MMAAAVPPTSASLLPLLECVEDSSAGQSDQTDAYITLASRLNGDEGRQFLPVVVKHFARLSKVILVHISSENEELCQAALQALGFCVFHSHIVSVIPVNVSEEILSTLCNVVLKSKEKFTCTRALWVISKQNFPPEVASKKAPEILRSLESMQTREVQSILIDHESLNVIIRLLEQAPAQMAAGAECWAKLVIPLVIHSASKVRLRAAAALEMGMPLLLEKQQEVAAIVEPMMSSLLIPEMQKLFASKNEANMLKLWPLFVRLLGKLLHKGGAFINSLLYLEELGFRNSSPNIKKIAFIAWKSLIDNFALNPDILCSSKRLKLLMQPLSSIHVRTEALMLTKLEVWWYLIIKLGPNLPVNFEQVGVPLLQSTLPSDSPLQCPATPARPMNNGTPSTPRTGNSSFNVSSSTPRMNLNSSLQAAQSFSSIQVLGLEMLLHWLGGPDVSAAAAKENLQLSLEPLTHPFLSSPSTFTRHASTLISAVRDGFIAVGKLAPDALIRLIWSNLTDCVRAAIEAGNKKERQGSEILTLVLQALQSILSCDELPAEHALLLLETTIKGIPQKVLGSAAYQVANMDVLNGTPALFLILLFYKSNLLSSFLEDERFFSSLETLVSCGFCGPTSPLAFAEAVLGAVARSVETVKNRKQLLRMWSVVVNPLTDTITRTNEVNQGDALEHNFSAIYSALMFPIVHVLPGSNLPQKSMNCTWSRLYKTFARCSALVATADENVCCEELCAKISAALDKEALRVLYMLDAVANILLIVIESIDFSPYTPQFQQKLKSPRTPLMWVRKKSRPLGNLTTFHALLIQTLEAFLAVDPSGASDDLTEDSSSGVGSVLVMILSCLFTNITLPTFLQELLSSVAMPLARLFEQCSSGDDQTHGNAVLRPKLEKLATDLFGSIQTHSTLHDDELLSVMAPLLCVLFPHKNKHIRSAVANFWNASFGNASALSYPETLRSVLSQTKQRTPLILPGFESVDVPDDCSEQFTNECSQLDPQISGVKMSSVGNRGSLVKRAEEPMERGSASKPVSVKLDFGSSKPLRQGALEEESSVDFVFIPPETKERVLTEHQKEVKRSKRVDIPALYNNLDASLDTTVFTQFSQSQDESVDASVKEDKDEAGPIEAEEQAATTKETLNDTHSLEETPEKLQLEANLSAEQVPSPSSDGLTEQKSGEQQEEEENSPNVSSSSDVVSGTPPVANSRRQSFITLEKYVEGQAASPVRVTFTGPLSRTSKLDISSTEASPHATETPKSEEVSSDKFSDSKEDVVPDTQNQVSNISSSPVLNEESAKSSPADDSQSLLDSQSSQEPRRSGRRRSKPQRPGQEAFVSPPKNASQDQAQNDKDETNSQTPKLPTDGTLTGRRLRTKIAVEDHLEGQQSPGKVLRKGSSQTDSQSSSAMSEELGQADSASMKRKKRSETLLSDSESDSQQTGRTLRSRALAASQKQDLSEKTSTDDQKGNKDQTNSDQAASSKGPNETPDSSQSQTRYRTRRSKGLVADSENSESRDDEKPKKRPRKSKTPDVSDSTEPSGTQTELNVTDVTASSELSLGRTSQDETDTQTATDISHSDMELHQGSTSEDPPEDGGEEHNISEMVADVDGHSVDVGEKDEGIKCSPQNESSPIKSEQGQKRKLQRRSRSRGRRRSKNTPQTEQSSLSEDLMDSQSSQSSFISVSEEIKSSDGSSEADVLPISGTALEAEASESATTKLHSTSEMKETDLELSKSNEELEEVQTKLLAGSNQQDRSQEEESESSSSPNIPVLNPLNDSSSQGPPAEEAPLNQDLDSHTLQEDVMKDMEDQTLPEHKNEENAPLPQDSNETEIPKDIGAKQDLEMDKELPVSVHDTAVEASNFDAKMYLDSPPKPKLVDVIGAELDSVLSPSRRASYGWSPSASPSTSILKKGQKRSCEEDTPSPCLKSRRVSFATPIYHQELADDIDRRSPVIRTSSPRSKVLSGQSKFITTPTKARSGLSPRALHSPGHRSSKKCLISEMSQEPRPVAKDCVYPPLVGCSTPIEAVLPQLTFNMWSRGFGQLIRARNIKTVGDLSGLTPSEIKSFPFRSPKLSNVKKALKRYHEQQKGRCDELKSFDEMEKMTSEPEETEFPQNQDEEQSPEEMLDVKKSELSDEDKADSLFSDTTALAGRYTPQELLHCSPEQLSLMHENLVGMMRSIMVHVQSRLQSHHADTLP